MQQSCEKRTKNSDPTQKPPKDTLLSEGKDIGNYIECSHLHYRTRKRAERKMTVYAFDRLRKQSLEDQENNRKRGKAKQKRDKNSSVCVCYVFCY